MFATTVIDIKDEDFLYLSILYLPVQEILHLIGLYYNHAMPPETFKDNLTINKTLSVNTVKYPQGISTVIKNSLKYLKFALYIPFKTMPSQPQCYSDSLTYRKIIYNLLLYKIWNPTYIQTINLLLFFVYNRRNVVIVKYFYLKFSTDLHLLVLRDPEKHIRVFTK